jgi:molybdate transport system ATP-binding protein
MTAAADPATVARSSGLTADVRVRLGRLDLEVALTAAPGEVVAVLGPNGAGKTTLLRALAGVLPLQGGYITLDGRTLEDPARGLRTAPQQRAVGVVFQDQLLFPHLSAADNVAFGLRARGAGRAAARATAAQWLARVGLTDHADARPAALSGGQAQRVALARALATDPALLLLDEPMAALDVEARRSVRAELRRHLADFPGPCVLVTHEPLEAIALADRLVIVEDGRVVQDGPPAEIARQPRSDWAARLVGLNLYRGVAHDHRVELETGHTLSTDDPTTTGEVFVAIHPRSVALFPQQPAGSPRNTWPATVDQLDLHDEHVRLHLDGPVPIVAQVKPAALADLGLREGSEVWVAVKATEVDLYAR